MRDRDGSVDSDLLELLPSCSWSGGRGLTPLHPFAERGCPRDPWKRALYPLEFRTLNFFCCLFIYFWLCWVFFAAHRLSLVAASGDYSLVVVRAFLIEVASLVELSGIWAQYLQLLSSRMQAQYLWPMGLAAQPQLPDQGSNPCLLH